MIAVCDVELKCKAGKERVTVLAVLVLATASSDGA